MKAAVSAYRLSARVVIGLTLLVLLAPVAVSFAASSFGVAPGRLPGASFAAFAELFGGGDGNAAAAPAALPPVFDTAFDFETPADGKADYTFWTPGTTAWQNKKSSNLAAVTTRQQGTQTDRIVPADYDGDGIADYAVRSAPTNGTACVWTIRRSSDGQSLTRAWGASSDLPVPGDYDGDGDDDIAVWRPSNGYWYITRNLDVNDYYAQQLGSGAAGDFPAAGDYDADGKTDIAVWRSSNGYWYVVNSADNSVSYTQWGSSDGIAVPADYDGDGRTDYAYWQPGTGMWNIKSSIGRPSFTQFGAATDVLVPADYDGDDKTDFAVWRPSEGRWYVWGSLNGQFDRQHGAAGDVPAPAVYINQTIPPGAGSATPSSSPSPSPSPSLSPSPILSPSPSPSPSPSLSSSPSPSPSVSPSPSTVPIITYDAVIDFSPTSNPSGVWSYGYKANDTAPFEQYLVSGFPWADTQSWSSFKNGYCCPLVAANTAGTTISYNGSVIHPADLLNLHPGPGGDWSVVRWTAPASGNYRIRGRFQGLDTAGTTTSLQILRNGAAVQTGDINSYGVPTAYDFTVSVAVGETFDFAVNFGNNGNFGNDSTGLAAIIATVPPPPPSPTVSPTPGVSPSPSPAISPSPQGVTAATLGKARLAPRNQTGGTNLYSQNFGWGTGIVSLPGRAGLDAGLGVSYNSLVWTRVGNTMVFDADHGNIAPGFRFGFPVIEPAYLDPQTNKTTYLMVTGSGARVELRQTDTANYYEAVDSSYLQLQMTAGGSVDQQQFLLRSTDGTQMTYLWSGGVFRCSQIKDRNGNFITVNHNASGALTSLVDTLGRTLNVNYDAQNYPLSITQNWQSGNGTTGSTPHTYATFAYTTTQISTSFNGLSISGITNGAAIRVLQSISVPTGNATTFEYNAYGQVKRINNYAADSQLLNSVATDLGNAASGSVQTDCPRLKVTTNKYEAVNGDPGFQTIVRNSEPAVETCPVAGLNVPGAKIAVSMDGAPHGVTSTLWYHPAGTWAEGLPFATEDFADGARQRYTVTSWTQENPALAYILNPRVAESKVGDAANLKRTALDYYTAAGNNFGLVSEMRLYDGNAGTLLKKVNTSYKTGANYVSRRIIGLPVQTEVSGRNEQTGQLEPVSKMTYDYDNFPFSGTEQILPSVIRHDTANYGAGYQVGRGNLTTTIRHDVTPGATATTVSNTKYNIAGAVVNQITPRGQGATRNVQIGYTDSFNDNNNSRYTYAYPTTITDPAGSASFVKYRFDIGANVSAESPAPLGQSYGKITARTYSDAYGWLEKEAVQKKNAQNTLYDYAYTRYDFSDPANDRDTRSKVYSTVNDITEEVLSETFTDGAGRVIKTRTPMSFSGTGVATWAGQKIEYDILGQVRQQTVPTEVGAGWSLAGDDAVRGTWLWTRQRYDWKGRVTRKINTDGADTPDNLPNASDVLIGYAGCGCAGGQQTTVMGELVPRDDVPTESARRVQKITEDAEGRTKKTEVMKWDGTTSYLTTITQFNGRDQATAVTQTDENSVSQITSMSYDGYGRLKTQRRPEQTAATVYEYNTDNSIQSMTDARGAKNIYGYNSRGLVNSISYTAPTGITLPAAVNFDYDALGNRIWMTDGLGRVDYEYDELSQMKAETRQFNDVLPNAPLAGNKFKLEYTYELSGQLKSYKDPFGDQINYAHDKIGRLDAVTGSSFAGITSYASNPQYRAWGGLKSLSYRDHTQMQMTYDDRLQVDTFQLNNSTQPIMKKNYDYYADGNLKYTQDELNAKFDRLNIYDHTGRIKKAKSAAEATGGTVTQNLHFYLPYRQSYAFDAFGNMTQRNNLHWGKDEWRGQTLNLNYTYQNNRVVDNGWQHDADGRVTVSAIPDQPTISTYDASGQLVMVDKPSGKTSRHLDGDGREGKRETRDSADDKIRYYLRSTVLGKEVVSEVTRVGKKRKTFVMASGATLATQVGADPGISNYTDELYFHHEDASGMSQRSTFPGGSEITEEDFDNSPVESDALGVNVGITSPYTRPRFGGGSGGPRSIGEGEPNYVSGQPTITLDGTEVSYATITALARAGGLQGITRDSQGRIDSVTQIDEQFGDTLLVARHNVRWDGGMPYEGTVTYSWANISSNDTKVIPLPKDFKERIESRLSKGDCNSFISRIISKVVENYTKYLTERNEKEGINLPQYKGPDGFDGFDLLEKISGQNGFVLENEIKLGDSIYAGATVRGSIKTKDAQVVIAARTVTIPMLFGDPTKAFVELYVSSAIHEMVHLAARGVSLDQDLAKAASDLGENKNSVESVFNPDPNEILKYSSQWDNALKKHCGEQLK